MGQELGGGCAPFGEGTWLHLTQCSRGLPPCQVSSWSIQPFGHNTPTSQTLQTDRIQRMKCLRYSKARRVGDTFGVTICWHFARGALDYRKRRDYVGAML